MSTSRYRTVKAEICCLIYEAAHRNDESEYKLIKLWNKYCESEHSGAKVIIKNDPNKFYKDIALDVTTLFHKIATSIHYDYKDAYAIDYGDYNYRSFNAEDLGDVIDVAKLAEWVVKSNTCIE